MRSRRALVASLLAATACGTTPFATGPPPKVPLELVPPSLSDGKYAVVENTGDKTRQEFSKGRRMLTGEGRLWEIRDGEQLVGTLQVTTVNPRLDLSSPDIRKGFVESMLSGTTKKIAVHDVGVFAASSNDKIVYLWFGKTLYQVLLLKGNTLDPESILDAVVKFQVSTDAGDRLLIHSDADEEFEAVRS